MYEDKLNKYTVVELRKMYVKAFPRARSIPKLKSDLVFALNGYLKSQKTFSVQTTSPAVTYQDKSTEDQPMSVRVRRIKEANNG